jgi:hypothetical protein
MMSVATIPVTHAVNLGDILKVGGVSILVDRFAGPLNNFINNADRQA